MRLSEQRTWIRNLEKHILHNIAPVWSLKFELFSFEQNVVETPDWCRQDSWYAWLTVLDLEHEVHSPLTGVARSPRLSRHGIRRVSVGSQTLSVYPSQCDGIRRLTLGQAEHLRRDCSSRDLDEHHMIKPDLVEGVFKRQTPLNLMSFDHGFQHILDTDDRASSDMPPTSIGSGYPVCYRKNTPKVVRRVSPFSCEPAVVVVEPANHGSDVESAIDGVEDIGRAGYARAIRDHCTFYRRP